MNTTKRRWDRTKPEERDPRGKWYTGKPTLEERLLSKIRVNLDTGCWEWTAARNYGYGVIRVGGKKGKTQIASRVSYELKHGQIPDGARICHRCDNPPCINPDHLFVGTQGDNIADMIAKGRKVQPKGAQCGRSKLTDADILAIRAIKGMTARAIAKQFGVSHPQILGIRSGKYWSHIPTTEKQA